MRVILLLFCSIWLVAADINSTILGGDAKVYEKILSKLKKDRTASDEKALQEALLYKLINISKAPRPQSLHFTTPKNEKEYRSLVTNLLNWVDSKANYEQSLHNLQDKIEAMQDQIQTFQESNDTSSLTLQLQYAFYNKAKNLLNQKLRLYEDAIKKKSICYYRYITKKDFIEYQRLPRQIPADPKSSPKQSKRDPKTGN